MMMMMSMTPTNTMRPHLFNRTAPPKFILVYLQDQFGAFHSFFLGINIVTTKCYLKTNNVCVLFVKTALFCKFTQLLKSTLLISYLFYTALFNVICLFYDIYYREIADLMLITRRNEPDVVNCVGFHSPHFDTLYFLETTLFTKCLKPFLPIFHT